MIPQNITSSLPHPEAVSPATLWLPKGIHKLRFVWDSSANIKNIIIEPADRLDI